MNVQRILLVEDEESHVKLFKRSIKRVRPDMEIFTASDGAQGLKQLDQIPLDGLLVLLDLNMPIMNGLEMLQHMRRNPHWQDVPVVVLTTSDYSRDQASAEAQDILAYLIKPVSLEQMAEILEM